MPSAPQGNHSVQSDGGDGEDARRVGENGRAILAIVGCRLVFGVIIAQGYDIGNTEKR